MGYLKIFVLVLVVAYSHSTCVFTCLNCTFHNGSYGCLACKPGYTLISQGCYPNNQTNSSDTGNNTTPGTNTNSDGGLSTLAVVFIVLGSVASVALIVTLVCCLGVCKKGEKVVGVQKLVSSSQQERIQISWVDSHQKMNITESCVICLEKKAYLQVDCQHHFHVVCIQDWLNQGHQQCPVCESRTLFPAKFYCRACYQKYLPLDERQIQGLVKQSYSFECNSCIKGTP